MLIEKERRAEARGRGRAGRLPRDREELLAIRWMSVGLLAVWAACCLHWAVFA